MRAAAALSVMALLLMQATFTQQQLQFGGDSYASLDPRKQRLVDHWATRFTEAIGQKLDAPHLYDDVVPVSTKTTFDAITHALMTSTLTDASGAPLGDVLTLVERVESVKGEVAGARGDRQFRMYARLTPGALDTLERSREFKRGRDNTVYHKGYPINYREQGGVPSIQVSMAPDGRRADIDVDYRSSSFPVALFNGHLSSSNSDVRAGNNYDRHINRWTGFRNWWRSFFGVRLERAPEEVTNSSPLALPKSPRAGRKSIDVMVDDFLTAWLVEGDIVAAMGYVSDRAYACLAQDLDDPSELDRGLAPFQIMVRLKAAHDALGTRPSLEGLTTGVRFTMPGLKVVTQRHHPQFVIYAVPDDIAAKFDCESQLMPGDSKNVRRQYGNYFGATFNVNGRTDHPVALLWGKDNGYWKIVSWHTGADDRDTEVPDAPPANAVGRIPADMTLVAAAHGFLDSWLVRKDYDAALRYLSPKSYPCYDLVRGPDQPPVASPEEAARRLRDGIQHTGERLGRTRTLDDVLVAVPASHTAVRVMDHPYAAAFTLTSIPDAFTDAADCLAMATGGGLPKEYPVQYGKGFGMTIQLRTKGGEAPVLRTLWTREQPGWRITAFDLEVP